MQTEPNLYYILVPNEQRAVPRKVELLSITQVLEDETVCKAIWDLIDQTFKTRSKFLAIWPSVRFVAVHRKGGEVGGFALVATPLNWQIDYVVVREDMRHQGIAAALVNEITNQALERQVPYVMLTSKESLRPLYEGQCGFSVVASNDTLAYLNEQQLLTA